MRHSKPDDIPDDVWAYAEAVQQSPRKLPPASAIEHHARAILAERERCAERVDMALLDFSMNDSDQFARGYAFAKDVALTAIRRAALNTNQETEA